MKKFFAFLPSVAFLFSAFFGFSGVAGAAPLASESETAPIILYVGEGCPHCAKVEAHFEEKEYFDAFDIEVKEIYRNAENANEFNAFAEKAGIPLVKRGVPMMTVGEKYFIGDTPIIEYIDKKYELKQLEDNMAGSDNPTDANPDSQDPNEQNPENSSENNEKKGHELTLPILISAALADAVNPCEFAVLIILLTSIIATGAKKRALASGLAFSLAIFLSYFAMGLGLYGVIAAGKFSATFVKIIGSLAILLGLFNLKDFFFYGKGFLMEVPMSWRPKMKALLKSATGPVGAFFIGILISLFLLPCTSGPYIVVTSLLAQKETFWYAFKLLLLYNFIFVSPMLLITIAVYRGFSVEKAEDIRQKKLRILHLIAGLLLVGMGIIVLLKF